MSRRLLLLIAGCLALWLLVGLPFRAFTGSDQALVVGGTAMLLCLVPALVTLAWADRALRGNAQDQLILVLGGTGLRMFFVLLSGLAVHSWIPYFQEQQSFWIWLLVYYLVTLAFEMALLLGGRPGQSSKTVL